jgi:hypothetical protein
MSDPIEIGAAISMIVASFGGVTVLAILARAWVKKQHLPTGAPAEEVGELRAAVEHVAGEVGELHERLEFTERVLAQQRDALRLQEGA